MPDLEIPIPGEGTQMTDAVAVVDVQATSAHVQNMAMVAGVGVVAQQNFVNLTQLANLAFLQERNMVSLPESLGAREVGSQTVPAGPKSGV